MTITAKEIRMRLENAEKEKDAYLEFLRQEFIYRARAFEHMEGILESVGLCPRCVRAHSGGCDGRAR